MSEPDDPTSRTDVPLVPEDLESPRSKLSFLYLRVTGGARMAELRDALGMSLLSLYPVVARLIDAGHVERTDDGLLRPRTTAVSE